MYQNVDRNFRPLRPCYSEMIEDIGCRPERPVNAKRVLDSGCKARNQSYLTSIASLVRSPGIFMHLSIRQSATSPSRQIQGAENAGTVPDLCASAQRPCTSHRRPSMFPLTRSKHRDTSRQILWIGFWTARSGVRSVQISVCRSGQRLRDRGTSPSLPGHRKR